MIDTTKNYIIVNGEQFVEGSEVFTSKNRAFRYGDGIFETIRVIHGKIPFLKLHFARLLKACEFLKIDIGDLLIGNVLESQLHALLEKNKLTQGAKVRLTVFRLDGGLYSPITNKAGYCIETEALSENNFELNTKGLSVELFSDIKKQIHVLSNLKTNNCLPYIMAGIYRNEKKFDDCIILNDKNHVCEAISSTIFLVINGALYTPSLAEGCVDGVMRKIILSNAKNFRINCYEHAVMPNDLLRADEVFLTNSVAGIQWVGSYKNKRYFNSTSKKLCALINELTHPI